MGKMDSIVGLLGERFGVLAESNTNQLKVIARDTDVAVGDMFLLPCRRGHDRFYIFRTTQYANVLNRTLDMSDVARNKLTMPDSYFSEDLSEEKLLELTGMILGYAQLDEESEQWEFHRPRRLPQHLTDVYHVDASSPDTARVMRKLMRSQLGDGGLYVGELLAGETELAGVPVFLPPYALSHHIGVFGRTGSGKSNLMMVLLRSIMEHNRTVVAGEAPGPQASILAIDPHDEFRQWHASTGGADGIHGIVSAYTDDQRDRLVEPFYYLTAREAPVDGLERHVQLSRADITPDDLTSTMEFSEQQTAFANRFYADHGERWIAKLLLGETDTVDADETSGEYLPGTVAAVQRRVSFLRHGHTRLFTRFDLEAGHDYQSSLADIVCALERGRVIIVDTTLMTEIEQFLLTTIAARVLFALRRALRSSVDAPERLPTELRQALGNDDTQGQIGMRTLADELVRRLEARELPYLEADRVVAPDRLPYVNVVVEEAPSILNPQRMRFGSVFRDISRQGRKFGIGLTVVSQQVTEIDQGILTQINTELTMALGNDAERTQAVRNASTDLAGFDRELQLMARGQAILSASYRDIPLPVQSAHFDDL